MGENRSKRFSVQNAVPDRIAGGLAYTGRRVVFLAKPLRGPMEKSLPGGYIGGRR